MGRPPALTADQQDEVRRRLASGAGVRALAREFGVGDATIRRLSAHSAQIQKVAEKLADAHSALALLPGPHQHVAVSLADKLRNISASLACAAEHGAATAHRLNALANSEVSKVDDAAPMESLENLRNVGVLTKLANDSASIALNLLSANKERMAKDDQPPADELAPIRPRSTREEWLARRGQIA